MTTNTKNQMRKNKEKKITKYIEKMRRNKNKERELNNEEFTKKK